MDIKTLESFSLSDAISFHDELNPKLWAGMHLRPEVRKQLKKIADDFMDELGISGLDVTDVTVSGSNAAYSYTPHSDLDLHILVDMSDMPNDEVYKELFNAKKNIYNDSHDITIHGVPVEVYVQDASEPVVSLGEYSIKNNDWIKLPTKRRANLDQTATRSKYNKLLDKVNTALKSNSIKKVNNTIKKIRQYRQAGLDKGGEFGPENLAYKVLRSQGYITKLYQLRDKLHSEVLTIENMYQNPEKVHENTNDYLWHGSRQKIPMLEPRQAVDTGGAAGSNQNAIYATTDPKFAISMGLTTPGSDFGHFPNDPQGVLFSGKIRKGENVYLHKLPMNGADGKPQFVQGGNSREFHSIPGVKGIKPIEIQEVPVDKYLNLIRTATPKDWELRKKYMKQGVSEEVHPDVTSNKYFNDPTENVRMGDFEFNARTFTGALGDQNARGLQIRAYDPKRPKDSGSIGSADFIVKKDKKGNTWLESDDTEVNDEYRGKGVAAMMYAFAKSLGNDIKRSPYQSKAGSDMWNKWGKDAEHLVGEDLTNQYAAEKTPAINPYGGLKDRQYRGGISEAFDQPYPIKWEKSEHGDYDALTRLPDGSPLTVMFDHTEPDEVAITFWRNNNLELTGEGDAQRVFATVLHAIREYLKFEQPANITFSASKEVEPGQNNMSRANLYNKLVSRYAQAWGYNAQSSDHDEGVVFHLSRKKDITEASGYIPSEKEKNDPRFKTALTVDVKPDSIKKNAKSFYWKTSRAGIPPNANPNGKF